MGGGIGMKTGKLTDVQIRSLKPGSKPQKHTDGGGLILVVTPAGGKNWRVKFRFEGKEQTLSLGAWPVVGLAEAREKALAAKKELKAGLNPAAEKQAMKRIEKEEALSGKLKICLLCIVYIERILRGIVSLSLIS